MRAARLISSISALLFTAGIVAGVCIEAVAQEAPASIAPAAACTELEDQAPGATFVALIVDSRSWIGCNVERARKPFLPASTFKGSSCADCS
jgi:hypothetical protein